MIEPTRKQTWKDANRPKRFVAYGFGFSGDWDTVEEAREAFASLVTYDPHWPIAVYERIEEQE